MYLNNTQAKKTDSHQSPSPSHLMLTHCWFKAQEIRDINLVPSGIFFKLEQTTLEKL